MKKILVCLAVLVCVASCELKPATAPTRSRDALLTLAYEMMYENISKPLADFKTVWCADMYINDPSDTRDLQWYAQYGRCRRDGDNLVLLTSNALDEVIRTNGLRFGTVSSEYSFHGYECRCSAPGVWCVKSGESEMILNQKSNAMSSVTVGIGGKMCRHYDDGYDVFLEPTLTHVWFYGDDVNSFYPIGNCRLTVEDERTHDIADWADIHVAGTIVPAGTTTSRD